MRGWWDFGGVARFMRRGTGRARRTIPLTLTICDAPHGVGGSCTGRHQWYSGDSGITFGRPQRFHEFFDKSRLDNDRVAAQSGAAAAVMAETICQQAQ